MKIITDKYPTKKNDAQVYCYEDLHEFTEVMLSIPKQYCRSMSDSPDWSGCQNKDQFEDLLQRGDQETLDEVRTLMGSIDAVLTPLTKKRQRRRSPFGNLSVPAYLSGHPEPCRRRQKLLSSQGKVTIWMDLSTSCVVRQSEMREYRTVVCSFAYALSKVRPVDLQMFAMSECWSGNSNIVGAAVPLPMRPMDAVAATILAHPGVFRGGLISHDRWRGDSEYDSLGLLDSSSGNARYLGAKRGDIVIPKMGGGTYSRLFNGRSPEQVAEELLRTYLNGEGFAFETYNEDK